MPKGEKLTKERYECIKIMLGTKEPKYRIAELLNVSINTVYRVGTTNSYEEYEAHTAIRKEKDRVREAEKKEKMVLTEPIKLPQKMPINSEDSYQIVRLIKEQKELLTLISNKLAFIVDELTTPCKRDEKR